MRAIDLITALKRLITCDHPEPARVAVILEGASCVKCSLCGAWYPVDTPALDHWEHPALVIAVDQAAVELAESLLFDYPGGLPDEPPTHREGRAPRPAASETRMAVAEARLAADRILELMFGCPPGDACDIGLGPMGEAARCLALCVEQLAAFQDVQRTKNVPAGLCNPDLALAARELRKFADAIQVWQQKLAAAKASQAG